MRDMLTTLDDALKLATQLQSVEIAQKRLHKEMRGSEDAVTVKQVEATGTSTPNAVYHPGNTDANLKIQELTKEVQHLADKLAQVKGRQFRPRQQSDTRRRPNDFSRSCWSCGQPGHIRRNCLAYRSRGRERRQGSTRPMESAATDNSALVVEGSVRGRPTKMLVNFGSAVSILHQDAWRASTTAAAACQLDTAVPPVVAANGGAINILGRTNVTIEVAGLKVDFPFLVAEKLTQECILGADFLRQHKCVIDLNKQILRGGGASADIESVTNTTLSVCHVTFPETTVLPGNSEIELPLQLSKRCHLGTAILEPAPKFMERHGILIAHSLTHTGPNQEKAMVRILNPSPAPAVVYQDEEVGILMLYALSPGTKERRTVDYRTPLQVVGKSGKLLFSWCQMTRSCHQASVRNLMHYSVNFQM